MIHAMHALGLQAGLISIFNGIQIAKLMTTIDEDSMSHNKLLMIHTTHALGLRPGLILTLQIAKVMTTIDVECIVSSSLLQIKSVIELVEIPKE